MCESNERQLIASERLLRLQIVCWIGTLLIHVVKVGRVVIADQVRHHGGSGSNFDIFYLSRNNMLNKNRIKKCGRGNVSSTDVFYLYYTIQHIV